MTHSSSKQHRNWKGYRLKGKRWRDRDPSKVDSILRSVFSNPKYHDKLSRYSFVTHWHEIVGSQLAQHARPMKVVRGELFIEVANPIRAQELSFLKDTLLERIKNYVQSDIQITNLRFVVTDNL